MVERVDGKGLLINAREARCNPGGGSVEVCQGGRRARIRGGGRRGCNNVGMMLADRPIQPIPKGTPGLAGAALAQLAAELGASWDTSSGKLRRTYAFRDFRSALRFVDAVGAMADEVDHHPDVELSWGKATIQIWTHTVGGLAEIDFVFAARCDRLYAAADGRA
jgi:4a-hydroxytetrahydrobiopterin dehydratase